MKIIRYRQQGSVLLMTVFIIALLSTVTMGLLEMNTEEIQVMQNQVFAAQALALAEAGAGDSERAATYFSDVANYNFNSVGFALLREEARERSEG